LAVSIILSVGGIDLNMLRESAQFEKALAQVSALAPSLLAKTFRGQLVPQDPNDEPASVLMGHITQSQFLVKRTER
jgi:type I restriction enzyme S subunit